jgi:molybdopterin-containing oxidoreductase family iron-sulfur binding subunit
MKRLPHDFNSSSGPRDLGGLWRSLEERAGTAEFKTSLENEFPAGAAGKPGAIDRRAFLKLMGASLALAGTTACRRRVSEKIVPYVTAPEDLIPGRPQYYATAFAREGYARGVVVEAHEGRPTKIEGNPDHPDSRGATDAATQAAILSLYDPDRSAIPLHNGQPATWADFMAAWKARRDGLLIRQGRGLALLSEPTTSPTLRRQLGLLRETFPAARWYQHTPLARYDTNGRQPDYDFSKAEVILAIGSDFLFQHPAALRFARDFSTRRQVSGRSAPRIRLYVIEPTPTVTGTMADLRLPSAPQRVPALLAALAARLESKPAPAGAVLNRDEHYFVHALARDLQPHSAAGLCLAGSETAPDIQAWARTFNQRSAVAAGLATFRAAVRSDDDPHCAGDLAALTAALAQGDVQTLVMLGTNPAHTAFADLAFAPQIARASFSLHLGLHRDETARLCQWHLPESHFLEMWGDLRAYDGAASIVQPLIEPLHDTRSPIEVLHLLATGENAAGYDLVRDQWRASRPCDDFESSWHAWLRAGVIPATAAPAISGPQNEPPARLDASSATSGLTLLFQPDAALLDGRWANNAWLQELPHPITHLVWDNALLISPALADERNLANGDLVALATAAHELEVAVWITPGQARDCLTLSLGYGRTAAGGVGDAHGFNAVLVRRTAARWRETGVTLRPTGRRHELVTTQNHFVMEGREPVREVSAANLPLPESPAPISLFPSWPDGEYGWGMVIDLTTCLGCNACIIACQAENNIPVVGKAMVARGRRMHWLRVDRYYAGAPDNPRLLHQPVPCMHCENAPCEVVCPVGATVHSHDGLNQMVYNRCVGTRYCSNNCPYKVRRFNFFDYRAAPASPLHLQENPNVTVRERGVMEKCTYCVQRINAARINADKANRRIRDGEIRTACQQACPAQAITFGDSHDAKTAVARRKGEPANYALLEELNTRPRTTYLARIRADLPAVPS